jgi:hypothetical protein
MATDDNDFSPGLMGKMDFLVGVPDDPAEVPRTYYQALMGTVYTLTRWQDGSTVRGEVPLSHLEGLAGKGIKEGWYSASGGFLGAFITLD